MKNDIDLISLPKLIKKYSVATPRYTSYPTAVEFTSAIGNHELKSAIDREINSRKDSKISLYLHVPFCKSLCYFCACNKIIVKDNSGIRAYIDAVKQELNTYKSLLTADPVVEQFHWGGGTPNFLSETECEELYSAFKETFSNFSTQADISIEIDPRTVTDEKLVTYRNLGFNRVSLGVQDFDAEVQSAVNRIQPYEDTYHVCEKTRELGFGSINLDLIYGLPKQNLDTFSETLAKVLNILPERIALYGYAHVTWKNKVQKSLQKHELPTPELRSSLFLCAVNALIDAGYVYIGMDHFALPTDELATAKLNGSLKRNFMGYSTHQGNTLLGFGPSSVSTFRTLYAQNETQINSYQDRIKNEGLAISKGVGRSIDDQIRSDVIENLLCYGEVDFFQFEKDVNTPFFSYFPEAKSRLSDLEEDGLVRIDSHKLVITETGRLFMRNIAVVFDAYIAKHQASEKPRFSQSV